MTLQAVAAPDPTVQGDFAPVPVVVNAGGEGGEHEHGESRHALHQWPLVAPAAGGHQLQVGASKPHNNIDMKKIVKESSAEENAKAKEEVSVLLLTLQDALDALLSEQPTNQ